VGGWYWRKGATYFVEAMERVGRRFPRVQLTIVTYQSAAEVLADFSPGLRQQIRVETNLGPDQLREMYASHDVLVVPSVYDGGPLVILEGMAAGMVVVATSTCGNAGAIAPGETGMVVPPRDAAALAGAIEALLADDDARSRLGQRAQARARGLTWGRAASATLAMYEEAVERARSSRLG
jgi:glycosyltransferase involved in cell wall biosynthesis